MRLRRAPPDEQGCSWEGCAVTLPPGGAMGKPGVPIPRRTGCALTFPRAGAWGNPVSPSPSLRARPSRGQGPGCAGLRHESARDGETRFPHSPAPGDYVHGSHPCGCAAHHRMNKVVPGRAQPSQTLPPGGAMGKPGVPIPLCEGKALPDPPTGWGYGETRCPHPLRTGCAVTLPPDGAMGKPGVPIPFLEGQTLPRAGAWVRGPPAGIRKRWGNQVSPLPCPRRLCSR